MNQQRCFEESGQWLENVDGTHLVLASGKLDPKVYLKKKLCITLQFNSVRSSLKVQFELLSESHEGQPTEHRFQESMKCFESIFRVSRRFQNAKKWIL